MPILVQCAHTDENSTNFELITVKTTPLIAGQQQLLKLITNKRIQDLQQPCYPRLSTGMTENGLRHSFINASESMGTPVYALPMALYKSNQL